MVSHPHGAKNVAAKTYIRTNVAEFFTSRTSSSMTCPMLYWASPSLAAVVPFWPSASLRRFQAGVGELLPPTPSWFS